MNEEKTKSIIPRNEKLSPNAPEIPVRPPVHTRQVIMGRFIRLVVANLYFVPIKGKSINVKTLSKIVIQQEWSRQTPCIGKKPVSPCTTRVVPGETGRPEIC